MLEISAQLYSLCCAGSVRSVHIQLKGKPKSCCLGSFISSFFLLVFPTSLQLIRTLFFLFLWPEKLGHCWNFCYPFHCSAVHLHDWSREPYEKREKRNPQGSPFPAPLPRKRDFFQNFSCMYCYFTIASWSGPAFERKPQ